MYKFTFQDEHWSKCCPPWCPKYPKIESKARLVRAFLVLISNLIIASVLAFQKIENPNKNVSSAILLILVFNLLLNIIFFVCFKNYRNCRDWKNKVDAGVNLKWFLNSGVMYTLLTIGFSYCAFSYFQHSNSSRRESAAQSRNLNNDCIFMNFFDSHDLWHFFSASAVFMASLGLLTVDDDLLDTPRDKIEVY